MSYTQIKKEQILKTDIDSLWEFMSSPVNLERITPEWMDFRITSENKDKETYPGMIISYKVTPFLKIPITWITEISHVKEKKMFVDEQRMGPYKMWHHQHIFKETKDGVIMTDIITYIPPFGILGRILNSILIKKRVTEIFEYRYKILEKIFNNN